MLQHCVATGLASTPEWNGLARGRGSRIERRRASPRLRVRRSFPDAAYRVRITISAYGLEGGTPPESAVTFANPDAGTPNRA